MAHVVPLPHSGFARLCSVETGIFLAASRVMCPGFHFIAATCTALISMGAAGCGSSPKESSPPIVSATEAGDAPTHGPWGATTSDADPSFEDTGRGVCGCGIAPICGQACESACGCCPCNPGDPTETRTVGGVTYHCSDTGLCYEPVPGPDASDVDASNTFGQDAARFADSGCDGVADTGCDAVLRIEQ